MIPTSVSAKKNILNDSIIVLKNVRIVDGTGASIKHDQTLIIRNGKITEIGVSSHVTVPAGAKVIDLSGHTVFPGLVMMQQPHIQSCFYGSSWGNFEEFFETLCNNSISKKVFLKISRKDIYSAQLF
jgi:imidazolonepropionase-like amidohydrolase